MNAQAATATSRTARGKDEIADYMREKGERARAASRDMARADTGLKNACLFALAQTLRDDASTILAANERDMRAGKAAKLEAALLDRLELNDDRIAAMADGVREVANLPDPVGEITDMRLRPSGIQVGRMRVPLGVVGIIYESRPNVTADAASLCLKSGNACILRGGSEAMNSNQAIARCIARALRRHPRRSRRAAGRRRAGSPRPRRRARGSSRPSMRAPPRAKPRGRAALSRAWCCAGRSGSRRARS